MTNPSDHLRHVAEHTEPLVSVIVPVYNGEQFLEDCLASIFLQCLRPYEYEIIVVDDASTDSTPAIVEQFAKSHPNLKSLRLGSNAGPAHARNLGVKEARGEFIFFVDGDDRLEIHSLESLLEQSRKHDADVVIGSYRRFTDTGRLVSNRVHPALDGVDACRDYVFSGSATFNSTAILIRRSLLIDRNIEYPSLRRHEDVPFVYELLCIANSPRLVSIPVYRWLVRPNSITMHLTEGHVADFLGSMVMSREILEKYELFDRYVNHWLEACCRIIELLMRRILTYVESASERSILYRSLLKHAQTIPELPSRYDEFPLVKMLFTVAKHDNDLALELESVAGEAFQPLTFSSRVNLVAMHPKQEYCGDVIIVCDVDYHVRSMAHVVRELRRRGICASIVNLSPHWRDGVRALRDEEMSEYDDIPLLPPSYYPDRIDWNVCKVGVWLNDHNPLHNSVLRKLNLADIPVLACVEGICDYLRTDIAYRPYRQAPWICVPGAYDAEFHEDRGDRLSIGGLPQLLRLMDEEPSFPESPRVVINVNFSYGVLDTDRDIYLSTAIEACDSLGVEYMITQHPIDGADLSHLSVSTQTMYDTIRNGSIFVSRFATGIIEALAMGKPVVYHNPHQEPILKYQNPEGAYQVTTDKNSLRDAIEQELSAISQGVDFRQRGMAFLHAHGNVAADTSPAVRVADTIEQLVLQGASAFSHRIAALTTEVKRLGPIRVVDPHEERQMRQLKAKYNRVLNSASWRFTRPFRALNMLIRDPAKFWKALQRRLKPRVRSD